MGITSINNALGMSYGAYSQKLTQKTKMELEKLGIPYSENMTEADAQRLIKNYEIKKSQNQKNNSNLEKNPSSSDLFEKAKKLAEKLGIEVNEGIEFQQLLKIIESAIEQKLSINNKDISALKKLEALSQELANIQAQSTGSSGYDNTNQVLMKSLEMMSEYNKNFLNK